jgi:hypothetical protein
MYLAVKTGWLKYWQSDNPQKEHNRLISGMHYGDDAIVHKVINFRLGSTLSSATDS